jgi:enamine deaminase RidA (YjgF/YER057c/UK114 family)
LKENLMERTVRNPWTWQDQFGFVHGNEIRGAERILLCAGQLATDDEGNPMHAGDMAAQIGLALDNLEKVLAEAGMDLSDIVRLNYYTTDVDAFLGAGETLGARFAASGCRPASTLLGVSRLAFVESLVEIEATAMA